MAELTNYTTPSIPTENMTGMKERAIEIIMRIPEGSMAYVVSILDSIENLTAHAKKQGESAAVSEAGKELSSSMEARRAAFESLESMIKPIPGLDEKKALEEWREEKFGYAGSV